MLYVPHEYQKKAYDLAIANPRYLIFLAMGMGKTVVTLTAIDDLLHDFFEVQKVLVIAPLRVAEDTWSTESAKWDHLKHLKLSLVLGSLGQRLKALNTKADIYIINRENVEWLVNHYQTLWPFDMVVIDELSSFKNPSSHRFKSLRKVMPLTDRFIGLTGTPAPNSLIDLWSQIYLVDKGERLGKTVKMYRETYFTPGWGNGHIVYKWNLKEGSEEKIFARISDICMSMKAEDWIKVPERLDLIKTITFPKTLLKQSRSFERDTIMELANKETIVASTAAVVTNKLLQFANGAIYDEERKVHKIHDLKLEALADLIESANGDPVIVFYSYQHDLASIKAFFPELDIRTIEGPKDIQDWNDRKIQVMCLHPASAGHGLNLQAGGNIIIWFGLNYSLELYQQANARLHRQGQTEKVLVHHIVAKDTMDEAVMEALARKDISQARLIEAVKARISIGQ
jgi:SNF2 family DNA or RNA helicase